MILKMTQVEASKRPEVSEVLILFRKDDQQVWTQFLFFKLCCLFWFLITVETPLEAATVETP